MPAWYAAADCFTMPSLTESFGLTYLEAMACGLPCVAPDDAVRREVIGEAGTFCAVADPDAYAGALAETLRRPWGDLPRRRAERFPFAATARGLRRAVRRRWPPRRDDPGPDAPPRRRRPPRAAAAPPRQLPAARGAGAAPRRAGRGRLPHADPGGRGARGRRAGGPERGADLRRRLPLLRRARPAGASGARHDGDGVRGERRAGWGEPLGPRSGRAARAADVRRRAAAARRARGSRSARTGDSTATLRPARPRSWRTRPPAPAATSQRPSAHPSSPSATRTAAGTSAPARPSAPPATRPRSRSKATARPASARTCSPYPEVF